MAKTFGKNACSKFLNNDVAEIILEGLGDTADHGYANGGSQQYQEGRGEFPPEWLIPRRIGGELITEVDQLTEDIGIDEGKANINGGKQ